MKISFFCILAVLAVIYDIQMINANQQSIVSVCGASVKQDKSGDFYCPENFAQLSKR